MAEHHQAGSGGLLVGGFVLGAAVGAVAGLLWAPKSGRETRKLLKKSAEALPELAEDLTTTVQIHADRMSEVALRNWDDTLLRLKEAITAGVEASQRQRQQLEQSPTVKESHPPAHHSTPV
ncbi:MAG: YtxH domain-containing protein [Elainella sp. Prado103]|jgi:gas vesicle protein|nr:YtxH domain-containing protein [Elainella sp. Prado103]